MNDSQFDSQFVVDALHVHLPSSRKRTNGGINVNCPMCLSMGEARPDTKMRCGVRLFSSGGIHIHCFNCKFSTKWAPGSMIPRKVSDFFRNLGVGDRELQALKFKAWQFRNVYEATDTPIQQIVFEPKFEPVELPKGALPIRQWAEYDLTDPNFLEVAEYAMSRGMEVFNATDLMWTPETQDGMDMSRRLIIPFFFKGNVVGYTSRAIDPDAKKRYYTKTPAHYLFNNQVMYMDRKFVILVEGQFDALAISGVSTQGAKLSPEQAEWLKDTGKTIVVLPDQDESGVGMVNLAVQYGFHVSFPNWDDDVKDANDAVNKYGRLFTVKRIIDNATSNLMKINFYKKKMVK